VRRPRSLAATLPNGIVAALTTGAVVLLATGCGGPTKVSSAKAAGPPAARAVADQLTSQSCSASTSTASSHEIRYCEFVLPGGRRFNCNMASFEASAPTVSEVEGSKSCVSLRRVSAPTASAHVVEAIARARACLTSHGLLVKGGAVPPAGHGPGGPEGELIVGNGTGGAFIAFYPDPHSAERLEPEVIRNARGFGGQVERRGAVTVLWIRPPASGLRAGVQACAFA
jgi:hypothetical protein